MITTGLHPKELWPGVEAFFGHTYDEHPTEYKMYFDMVESMKSYDERVQRIGMGLAPVKTQGASVSFEDVQEGYTSRITNITYGLGGKVTREAIEDGQYDDLMNRVSGHIAFSLRQTLENVGANVINRAFNSTYAGGDGKELISNAHPNAIGGTFSNYLTIPADLTETSLEDLLKQIMKATDSKGLLISLIGEKLLVPVDLVFEATRIMESVQQSGNANNDINALRKLGFLPGGISTCHYFNDTDAWFIKTNIRHGEGLICQNRRAVEFTKDNEHNTQNASVLGTVRKGFGWADPLCLFGSEGA